LVRLTKPQDWEEGSRPIAWPNGRRQEEFLGLSPRRVQALNRVLQEAGIFVMRDDPQGRRYGHRDPKTDRIVKAFGFDLSLLMERHEEFKKIAADAQIERNRMKKLRQQKTLARKAIAQAAQELAALDHDSEALQRLLQEAADLVKAGGQCRRSDELALAVKALERRRDEVQSMLRGLIKPVEKAPMGAENGTHSTSTTLTANANDSNHTVNRSQHSSGLAAPPVPDDQGLSNRQGLFPETLHVTPTTLVELAPRLAPYMPARTTNKDWPALVDAALFLSAEMGINRTLWIRACHVMGQEYAAVAVAIVSTRPAEHFTSGPGGYFAGMLRKFEKDPDSLCLGKTLWRLKDQAWGKEGIRERRAMEKAERLRTTTRSRAYPAVPHRYPARELPGQADAPMPPAVPQSRPLPAAPAPSATSHWKPSAELFDEVRKVALRRHQLQQERDSAPPTSVAPEDDAQ
jgi:replication initiation protein RepC